MRGARASGRQRWVGARSPAGALHASVLLLLPLLACCEVLFDKKDDPPRLSSWTPEQGWAELPPGQSSPTAAGLRADAVKAFQAGNAKDALEGLLEIENVHSQSKEAREAGTSFLIGECYFQLNNYEEAYRYYQTTLKRRPPEETLSQTLMRIYTIGLAYLRGNASRSFIGIEYRSPSYGIDMLIGEQGLVTKYPYYLSFGDDALLEISNYYFDRREYADAERVLDRLVRDYPASEWHERAEYRLGLTAFKEVRGVEYDQHVLKKAKRLFEQYRAHYPRGVHIEEVREHLRSISEMEAAHELKVAKYYLRESRPQAAIYYLRSVLLNHPKTDAFREAQEIHNQLSRFHGGAPPAPAAEALAPAAAGPRPSAETRS